MARRGKQGTKPVEAEPMQVTSAARVVRRDNVVELPSVRNYRTWSPGLIRSAELSADGGNLRLAVDLVDWILSDDKVQGALRGRTGALFGLPLSFEADQRSDGRRRSKAVKALEIDEDWWASFRQPEVRQMFEWAVVLGYGPGRIAWTTVEGHGGRVLPITRFHHPQPIRFDWPSREWRMRTPAGSDEVIEWGNGDWVGHFPNGTYRPWSQGAWRGISRWCLLKLYAIGDWGRAGEKASRDVVESATELDKNESTRILRQELANDIYEAARDGVIVLPRGFTYKAVETVAGTKDIFEAQIDAANMAIAISLRGSNLTSGIKPGVGATYGAAKQHGNTDQVYLKADAESWEETAHDQVLVWWAEYNYGDRTLAPYPEWDTEEDEDLSQFATTMQVAADGLDKFITAGFEIDQQLFIDRFGFDFLKASEEPLKPKPAPAPGFPPAAPPAPGKPAKQPQPPPSKAEAQPGVLLASGAPPAEAPGFVDGQLYADALVEGGVKAGTELAQLTLDAVIKELKAATSYDDLRKRLRARYADLSADDFADLVYRHMVVAQLAGRHAVNTDANR